MFFKQKRRRRNRSGRPLVAEVSLRYEVVAGEQDCARRISVTRLDITRICLNKLGSKTTKSPHQVVLSVDHELVSL